MRVVLSIAVWYFDGRMKFVVWFVLCVVLFHTFAGERGIAILNARRDATRLAAGIASLRSENARLRTEVQALRDDPAAIERVARETLGLARAEEVVVMRER